MNKLLNEQINKHLGSNYKLDSDIATLVDDINKTYTEYENKIENLFAITTSAQEITSINQELRQSVQEQSLIISNLKKAIASLEPNSQVLQTTGSESLDEATYLTESLIKLIEAHKDASEKLAERKTELEKLNVLLEKEKSELAEQRAQDQAVLLAIGDGLIVTNTQGIIIMVNNSFEKLIGWTKADVVGHPMSNIIRKEDQIGQEIINSERLHIKAIKTGESFSTPPDSTYFYVRKDGSKFPVTVSAAPIKKNNTIIGAVEVFKDITKEKEIDKAKSEFVSLASHQLRTPLSSINWYTEMLLDDNLQGTEEEYKAYLKEIATAAGRMADMINALLNVSRLELGTFAIEPEVVNVLDVALKVVNELRPRILHKGHVIEGRHNDTIPPIRTDPKLLSMVFQNLITNAIKYTPDKGKIIITMTMAEDGNNIIISVEDNGYGIPDDEQKKIFTKMYRATNIMKHDTDGNGLGLYIVKLILNSLGGEIWFKSEENKGSSFYLTLPLQRSVVKKEGKAIA